MQRQRGGLVLIAECFSGLNGPVEALRPFIRFDQVDQLTRARH